jgi:transposase
MGEVLLPLPEIAKLKAAHRHAKTRRGADRIKAVVLLGKGWTAAEVAEALLVDEDTVRNYWVRYRAGGLRALQKDGYTGGLGHLDAAQMQALEAHLRERTCLTVQEIVAYVQEHFGVAYTVSGMTDLLHRLKFVYKKPKRVPGKADPKAQESFLEVYEKLKENKGDKDPVYFMDGTHPQHNTMPAYGWIKEGEAKEIKSNTGRKRLNINGALNSEDLSMVARFDESINAQSTLALLGQLERRHAQAKTIYVICDNAAYYRSAMVSDSLKDSKVELVFLPPYSPNLNLIERYWKFFKKKVLYNRYYEKFVEFKEACVEFFRQPRRYLKELRSLLTQNFQIIGAR